MNSFLKSVLCASTVLGAGLAVPAMAQTAATPAPSRAPDAAAPDVATIVVTARRTEERLQDVPISISVFNQQTLANANIVNSQDLARITPSLSANSNFGGDNSSYAIRGFVQEIGTAPSVGVFFADVVAPRALSNGITAGDGAGPGSFFDLQNVQVLKGPQGTLFGENTTGGDVLLVPQKPTDRFEGYVEGSYGNYDMRRLEAVVNAPINDSVRLRLGVDHQLRDGYLNNTSGIGPQHLSNVNYTAFRASLVVDVTQSIENYTVFSYNTSNTYGDVQKLVAAPGGVFSALTLHQAASQGSGFYDLQQSETNPESKLTTWQAINTTTWRVSDNLTIKNIASYAELKDDMVSSLFGVVLPFSLPSGNYPVGFTEVHAVPGGDSAHEKTITEELQFQGRALDNRFTWQGGGYFEAALPIGIAGNQSSFLASCTNTAAFQCTDPIGLALTGGAIHVGDINYTAGQSYSHDVAIYGQGTYKLTDQLKLTGGYRYTWDREEVRSVQKVFFVDFPPSYGLIPGAGSSACTQPATIPRGCASNLYQQSNKPTWMLDLDYTPSRDLLVYAKYSRGYRAGTIAPNITAPLDIVKPETVNTYEVGFKSSFRAPLHATFDASLFYNDFTNQQIQVGFNKKLTSALASTAAPINAGASEIYGAEVNASITPYRGLVFDVAYSYLYTRINQVADLSSYNDPNFNLSAPFKVGDQLALSPANKIVLNGAYTLPVPDALGKMSVGATFTHTDKQLANYSDRTVSGFESYGFLPATDLLDLNANWRGVFGHPVDASFFATNVTGQHYYVYAAGLATSGLGFESLQLGQPTMYGVRLKYHF